MSQKMQGYANGEHGSWKRARYVRFTIGPLVPADEPDIQEQAFSTKTKGSRNEGCWWVQIALQNREDLSSTNRGGMSHWSLVRFTLKIYVSAHIFWD